jgi:L-fuculose-phosphate aldolase
VADPRAGLIAGLIALGRAIAAAGLVHGSGGNISARDGDRVWITARGAELGALSASDLVALDAGALDAGGALDGGPQTAGTPSSEWRLHLAAYRARPEAGWVVHSHPPHGVALGLLGQALPALTPDQYFQLGAEVPIVAYLTPTTPALAAAVERALAAGAVAALLQNHGVLVSAPDAERARLRSELLEASARVLLLALAAGPRERLRTLSADDQRALDEATGGRYRFA